MKGNISVASPFLVDKLPTDWHNCIEQVVLNTMQMGVCLTLKKGLIEQSPVIALLLKVPCLPDRHVTENLNQGFCMQLSRGKVDGYGYGALIIYRNRL